MGVPAACRGGVSVAHGVARQDATGQGPAHGSRGGAASRSWLPCAPVDGAPWCFHRPSVLFTWRLIFFLLETVLRDCVLRMNAKKWNFGSETGSVFRLSFWRKAALVSSLAGKVVS